MHVSDLEPGDYQVIALAQQKSPAEIDATGGAKYRRTQLKAGDPMTDLYTHLDRGQWREVSYPENTQTVSGYAIDHQNAPMDTLWHAMTAQPVKVVYQEPTYTDMSLTRNNNSLHISLRQLEEDEALKTDIADYDIYITDYND